MTHFDLIIIGAGPGGYDTAAAAAASGKRTLLIERGPLGGTCLNCGCIPTKALRHTALLLSECRAASAFGIQCSDVTLDFRAAMRHKDDVVSRLQEGIATILSGVEVIHHEASFIDRTTVKAGDYTYTAPQIIIATGSRPASLPIPGAEYALSSTDMLELQQLPESLVVIGGGVIGMEFASIFNAFGSRVTVLEMAPEILPAMDPDIARRLRMLIKRRGIDIVTSARVESISPNGIVTYSAKGKSLQVTGSHVLMAVGRRAVLPPGIEHTSVAVDRGFISVDPLTMATSSPGIYAVGDVNGLCLLAHAARAQGLVALGLRQNLNVVPSVAFTIPECAMVGLSAAEARQRGINTASGTAFYRANGKAVTEESLDGMLRITVDADSDLILGCHAFGPSASMLVQEVSTAMSCSAKAAQLTAAIRSHPTLSEIITDALHAIR